ncbi:MAG: glycosyltransferase family protein [Promethearchaeota archaeon]
MKIIFNHHIRNWYWQIYDELSRNYRVIIPDIYKKERFWEDSQILDSLEETIRENNESNFIFDFKVDLLELIRWKNRNINKPIVVFAVNAIMRPYLAKMSVFADIWYVERYAKPTLEKYNRDNLIYRGLAANPYILYPLNLEKVYDLSFIGRHYGERAYWLNIIQKFAKKSNLKCIFPLGHGEKMHLDQETINQIYNQSKINLAFAPKEPPGRIVNLRTFEICISGNFQLMQYTPVIEDFFEIDEEIVCWKNKNELFEKILYYIENGEEREKIAEKGYKRAIKDHTWTKRFEDLNSFLKLRKKDDLSKYKVIIDETIGKQVKKEITIDLELNENRQNLELVKLFLKKRGYRKKKEITVKEKLKITLKDKSFYFKPNLKNFLFVEIYGKTMMIIEVFPENFEIGINDWEKLKKIIYLKENEDSSLPQIGVLTNGKQWIIKDFKNNKWLKNLPSRNTLKNLANIQSFVIIKFIQKIRNNYQRYELGKILLFFNLKRYLKLFYDRIEKIIRRLLKSPRVQLFN